jgi:hypothetical protein
MANSIGNSGRMISGAKTVTTAGTAEALGSGIFKALTIIPKVANTGQVYVGGSDVASATNDGLDAGDTLVLGDGRGLSLSSVYIDVDTSGEGVDFYGTA